MRQYNLDDIARLYGSLVDPLNFQIDDHVHVVSHDEINDIYDSHQL